MFPHRIIVVISRFAIPHRILSTISMIKRHFLLSMVVGCIYLNIFRHERTMTNRLNSARSNRWSSVVATWKISTDWFIARHVRIGLRCNFVPLRTFTARSNVRELFVLIFRLFLSVYPRTSAQSEDLRLRITFTILAVSYHCHYLKFYSVPFELVCHSLISKFIRDLSVDNTLLSSCCWYYGLKKNNWRD